MSRSTATTIVIAALIVLGATFVLINRSDTKNPAPSVSSPTKTNPDESISSASDATPAAGSIDIKNMAFTPSQISVQKGATVTWTNNDTVAHTVTDDLNNVGGPASESIAPGAKYSFTFNKTGSYQYHCTFHSSMRGTIVVK